MKQAHWHVLGAGAMGCLFACELERAGSPVTLLLRKTSGRSMESVRMESVGSCCEFKLPVSAVSDSGSIDHLLVTTKAYDVHAAVLAVAHRLEADCPVLLLSNGLGFAEALRQDLPELNIVQGTTTQGAYLVGTRHVRHAGRGPTRIGRPGLTQPPDWFDQWSQAVPDTQWDADIDQALWLKLAINCAINPLTALHGCANGELARRPELAAQVARLCDEIMQISVASGFSAATRDLHDTVARVIADTAGNLSSMLQDVRAGRRTEIDFITGHLLAVARRHSISAPENESMLRRICQLER